PLFPAFREGFSLVDIDFEVTTKLELGDTKYSFFLYYPNMRSWLKVAFCFSKEAVHKNLGNQLEKVQFDIYDVDCTYNFFFLSNSVQFNDSAF
ncbi:MAG: hypothetical protein O7C60_07505, partial [Rickettsia endosymbiont of Ixodes persulcatus]|nr:hypothetical protein [Rickettsia endosymbiont of Ixodes persulcatus]